MNVKLAVILAALVVVGIVLHFALKNEGEGGNGNSRPALENGGDENSNPAPFNGKGRNSRPPMLFNRSVQVNSPPLSIKSKGLGNRVDRLLDRLIWGTHRAGRWAIDDLVETVDLPIIEDVVRRININRRDRSTIAKKYIDLLAELKDPRGLPTLIDCAGDPNRMIRIAALKGLSSHLSEESTEMIVEQAELGDEQVRTICLDILATRQSPEIESLYHGLIDEGESIRISKFAVEGLGGYDTPESRELLHRLLDDPRLDISFSALKGLASLGDPKADKRLEELLRHKGPVRRTNAAMILSHAKWLPSLDLVNELAQDASTHVRVYLTNSLIRHLQGDDPEKRERADAALRILLENGQAEVRWKALEALHKAGDKSVAFPMLRKLSSAKGAELGEAVESTTSILMCSEAEEILVRRFRKDQNLTPPERVTILNGLSSLKSAGALDLFFEVIRGGWKSRTAQVGDMTVAQHAAFRVHHLEGDVLARWRAFLEEDAGTTAGYFFVNGVRSLEDPDAAVDLARIAKERRHPVWLRMEAVKSFAFRLNPDAGKLLLDLHGSCGDRAIADLALDVYWNYF